MYGILAYLEGIVAIAVHVPASVNTPQPDAVEFDRVAVGKADVDSIVNQRSFCDGRNT